MPDTSMTLAEPRYMDIDAPASAPCSTIPGISTPSPISVTSPSDPSLILTFPAAWPFPADWSSTTVSEVSAYLAGDFPPHPGSSPSPDSARNTASNANVEPYLDDIHRDRLPTFSKYGNLGSPNWLPQYAVHKLTALKSIFGEECGVAHLLLIAQAFPPLWEYVTQLSAAQRSLKIPLPIPDNWLQTTEIRTLPFSSRNIAAEIRLRTDQRRRAKLLKRLEQALVEVEVKRPIALRTNNTNEELYFANPDTVADLMPELPVPDGLFLRREIANLRVWLLRNDWVEPPITDTTAPMYKWGVEAKPGVGDVVDATVNPVVESVDPFGPVSSDGLRNNNKRVELPEPDLSNPSPNSDHMSLGCETDNLPSVQQQSEVTTEHPMPLMDVHHDTSESASSNSRKRKLEVETKPLAVAPAQMAVSGPINTLKRKYYDESGDEDDVEQDLGGEDDSDDERSSKRQRME